MHYATESDTGHMTLMHARLKRLHDSMKARGASDVALARLPKLPRVADRLDAKLPPVVLATAKNGTHPLTQAGAKAWLAKVSRVSGRFASNDESHAAAKARARGRREALRAEDAGRVKVVRETAAQVYRVNVESFQFAWKGENRICRARQHAIAIAREVTGLSWRCLSPFFENRDMKSLWSARRRVVARIATDPQMQEWDRQIRAALPAEYFERREKP